MNNEFYKCLSCNQNLCLLCRSNHNLNHNVINYDQKNYICQKHNEPFIKYCSKCNMNLCFSCEENHETHETISLGELKPNLDESKSKLMQMNEEINLFNNKIEQFYKKIERIN